MFTGGRRSPLMPLTRLRWAQAARLGGLRQLAPAPWRRGTTGSHLESSAGPRRPALRKRSLQAGSRGLWGRRGCSHLEARLRAVEDPFLPASCRSPRPLAAMREGRSTRRRGAAGHMGSSCIWLWSNQWLPRGSLRAQLTTEKGTLRMRPPSCKERVRAPGESGGAPIEPRTEWAPNPRRLLPPLGWPPPARRNPYLTAALTTLGRCPRVEAPRPR